MSFRFENLDIWKLAISFALKIYKITEGLPQDYRFDLGSQLRRSGLSVPNNIAEGSGASTTPDFKRFLDIAVKSVFETISGLVILEKLTLLSSEERENLSQEAENLVIKIRSFKKSLNKQ